MSRHFLYTLVLLFFCAGCDILSGDDHTFEFGHAVVATADGGYLVVGQAPNGGDHLARLYRYDERDRLRWQRTLKAGDHFMIPQDAMELPDGGFAVAGFTYDGSGHGGYDPRRFALLRADDAGRLQWHKVYGGPIDELYDIHLTHDGSLLLSGMAGGDPFGYQDDAGYWALMDPDGTLRWERTDSSFRPVDVTEAHDGGYVAVTNAARELLRMDADGTLRWHRRLEGTDGVGFILSGGGDGAIRQHGDGYVVVGANHDETYANQSIVVLKVNAEGDLLWKREIHPGVGIDLLVLQDERILVVGAEVSDGYDAPPFIHYLPYAALLDASGRIVWERTYDCHPQSFTVAAARLHGGDVVLSGSTRHESGDARIMRLRLQADDGAPVSADCD